MSTSKAHSRFGGSSAHRWRHCPASAVLPQVEDKVSAAGARGDKLHALAEQSLRGYAVEAKGDDLRDISSYVGYCRTIPATDTYVEHMVQLPSVHPEAFGTVDFIAWDSKNDILWVVDLKTGKHRVEAKNNDQLLYYTVGVEDTLNIKPKEYRLVIHQNGVPDIWVPDPADVVRARFDLGNAASLAETSQPVMGEWCDFCKVKVCPAKEKMKSDLKTMTEW